MLLKLEVKGYKNCSFRTSATAGISCGPFVWICSSALAVGTYVATDIAVNTGDEFFSRDETKRYFKISMKKKRI